jgi:hypothetical protein
MAVSGIGQSGTSFAVRRHDGFVGDGEDGSFAEIKSQQFQNDLYELVPRGGVCRDHIGYLFVFVRLFDFPQGGLGTSSKQSESRKIADGEIVVW